MDNRLENDFHGVMAYPLLNSIGLDLVAAQVEHLDVKKVFS